MTPHSRAMPPSGRLPVRRLRTSHRLRTMKGFSLVELLVAASLAAVMLTAAWGWVWTTASAARGVDARGQDATARAFAARMLRADLSRSVGLGAPDQGVCGPTTLVLVTRDAVTGMDEVVTVAWDSQRGVVWRKAAGSYLAEGVTSFGIRYFGCGGEEIVPANGALGLAARATVRRLAVEWTTAAGRTIVAGDLP